MDELVEGQIEQGMAIAIIHDNEIQDQEVRDGFLERKRLINQDPLVPYQVHSGDKLACVTTYLNLVRR